MAARRPARPAPTMSTSCSGKRDHRPSRRISGPGRRCAGRTRTIARNAGPRKRAAPCRDELSSTVCRAGTAGRPPLQEGESGEMDEGRLGRGQPHLGEWLGDCEDLVGRKGGDASGDDGAADRPTLEPDRLPLRLLRRELRQPGDDPPPPRGSPPARQRRRRRRRAAKAPASTSPARSEAPRARRGAAARRPRLPARARALRPRARTPCAPPRRDRRRDSR